MKAEADKRKLLSINICFFFNYMIIILREKLNIYCEIYEIKNSLLYCVLGGSNFVEIFIVNIKE